MESDCDQLFTKEKSCFDIGLASQGIYPLLLEVGKWGDRQAELWLCDTEIEETRW